MGIDIHVFCEARHGDEQHPYDWYCADHFKYNWRHDTDSNTKRQWALVPLYTGRCSELFDLLGLGVVTSSIDIDPIDEPRGLPESVDSIISQECEKEKSFTFGQSWFTLKELLDWQEIHDQPIREQATKNGLSDEYYGIIWALNNLADLINRMKDRFYEEFNVNIYDSEAEKLEKIRAYGNNFRIVFWFDN